MVSTVTSDHEYMTNKATTIPIDHVNVDLTNMATVVTTDHEYTMNNL